MADLVKMVARLEAETAQYHRKLDAAGRRISAFEKQQNASLKRIQTSFRTAFAALGVGAVVRQLATITKGTLDYADSVAEASDALGITTKSYQELQYATSQAGLKQDQFTQSFSKFVQFGQDAAQGKKGPAETFARVGITAEEAGGNVDELFNKFVKGLDNIASESEKLQLIGDAFGAKVASKWAATFAQGSRGLDEMRVKAEALGLVLSEDNIRAMGQLADAVDTLGVKFRVAFAEGLAEGLTGKAGDLRDIMADPSFLSAVDGIATGFKAIGHQLGMIPAYLSAIEPYIPMIKVLAAAATGTAIGGPLVGAAAGIGEAGYQAGSSLTDSATAMALRNQANVRRVDDSMFESTPLVNDSMFEEVAVAATKQAVAVNTATKAVVSHAKAADTGTVSTKKMAKAVEESITWQDQYTDSLDRAAEHVETYSDAVAELALNLQEDLKNATSNLFQDLIEDPKNWKDAMLDYFAQVGDAFAKMAADMAVQALFGTTGGQGGINWGQLAGGLISALGGGASTAAGSAVPQTVNVPVYRAAGGPLSAGQWAIVGENGPELVMSRQATRVFSNDQTQGILSGGGTTLVQNFAVKDFDSFKRSERQMRQHGKAALGIA